ncbi:TatD family hydrolase [Gordonibacter urolithinfaciens]|uniref:TatD family hydrolase n=1 Tax=Gordonibacter urolithinfaciens TaxID=1335613 RepID=UPI00174CE440|nr:TatD family hydrolase [Gordonibacter urolithinfaciens]HJF62142.1 TatD family hydrolase [Gordonibacter urolithinfaciens]
MPRVRIATGCHPHNAKHYDDALEAVLRERLADPRTAAVGEIGLDFHYDFSPRDDQRSAFRRQLRVAKECGLPVILHVREAHDEALAIMRDEGFPEAGTLLHCFNLDWDVLEPWVEAGCYVAFGGPLTFKKGDDTREAAARVPADRLLTETDAPYMTPEPLRGTVCGPEHVIFTAERLAEVRGCAPGEERAALLRRLLENARSLLDREPTVWQQQAARQFYANAFATLDGAAPAAADGQ